MIHKNVQISNDLETVIGNYFAERRYSRVAVLVDENTEQHCLPYISPLLPDHGLISIKSGEKHKNLDTCRHIWDALTNASFDRKSLLVNLGGGVIGDMGGFCAATFKRGIDFINIPTTLLSQVDASVGGKLGVDFGGLKNHIGLFKHPETVIVSSQFLQTLSDRELRSGFAEVLKHALIADQAYWEVLISNDIDAQDWNAHIEHSIGVKSKIVEEDFFETGQRKLLNFGHTIGHAIETVYLERERQRLLHGEAIAIGMICEAFISVKKAGLGQTALTDIVNYLKKTYGLISLDKSIFEPVVNYCLQDKKNQADVINCTLLKQIGIGVVDMPISTGEILDAMFYYNRLSDK